MFPPIPPQVPEMNFKFPFKGLINHPVPYDLGFSYFLLGFLWFPLVLLVLFAPCILYARPYGGSLTA